VMTNARGMKKHSAEPGEALTWISKFGSITFNQYGKEFPTGGMNEKGLVVELMWLDETKYPAADSRTEVNVLQWIQYQLDNCATIEDVIATDKKIRIKTNGTPLHYLVADSLGHAATIEFLDGKMVVHKDKALEFPVLTNSTYAESLVKTGSVLKANKNVSMSDNSLQRFADACSMIRNFKSTGENALDYSFSILDKVSQGQYTRWSIVYDITNRKIHFITSENKDRREVAFADFKFDCSTASQAIDMNREGQGAIGKYFSKLGFDENKKLIETSAKLSSSHVRISAAEVSEAAEFFRKPVCDEKVKSDVTN
jgi:penicillin V acylase-like amidase (Ntn superfamily)